MKKKKSFIVVVLVLVVALAGSLFYWMGIRNKADMVIMGTIYQSDQKGSTVSAVAIKDGVYQYVGDKKGVQEYIGKKTKVIDTEDGMAMPSFMEAHAHGHQGGVSSIYEVDLNSGESVDDYVETIKTFIKDHPDLKFINGSGWLNGYFGEAGPNKDILDKISKDLPIVLVSGDHHSYWANSKAMELAGINKNTKDVKGGVIGRDKNGNPTGVFREKANGLIEAVIPNYTVEQYKEGILAYQKEAASYGITAYFEPMVNLDGSSNLVKAYKELDKDGKLKIRVYGGYLITDTKNYLDEVDKVAKLKEETKDGNFFKVTTIKLLVDGVIEGKTAALSEPYANDPNYKGELLWKQEDINALCLKADKLGIQVHSHTIGDEATTVALNAYEYVAKKTGKTESRHALTHVQIVKKEDIKRMADLKVVVAANSYWFLKEPGYFYELEEPYLGKERAEHEYPMKDFFDAGITVDIASDYPVTIPSMPLSAIQAGVTRCAMDGDQKTVLGKDQRVTVQQMLNAATINGAYGNFAEKEYGSIEKGKSADLIILDQNLLKISPYQINNTKVLKTILKGKVIYQNKK